MRSLRPAIASGLFLASAGILGYHPDAEDGGIYLAEIKHVLDPSLYPLSRDFVSGHLGPPFFADCVAAIVRFSGLPLAWAMLLIHLLCVSGLLLGTWRLAQNCFATPQAKVGAVGLVAVAMGVPVAGTSLLLMDPYVTARSLSLTLTILSLSLLVRQQRVWAGIAIIFAMLLHPLMGALGVGEGMILASILHPGRGTRIRCLTCIGLLLLAAAWIVQANAPPETPAYLRVAATRYYWFLSQWRWYELFGLAAPLAILAWFARRGSGTKRQLAGMSVVAGAVALTIAVLFARRGAPVHGVARLQPLRCFQVIYLVLLLLLGGSLGEYVLRRSAWRWALSALILMPTMFAAQRLTYPATDHLELPGRSPRNPWQQAFLWSRDNTPRDALFALDADYVHRPAEDTHGFRAIAERSALPDYSKDGGQAAIRPELTPAWIAAQKTQARLTDETDTERLTALTGTGVSWLVLGAEARTRLPCPYRNATVMVCRLPPP